MRLLLVSMLLYISRPSDLASCDPPESAGVYFIVREETSPSTHQNDFERSLLPEVLSVSMSEQLNSAKESDVYELEFQKDFFRKLAMHTLPPCFGVKTQKQLIDEEVEAPNGTYLGGFGFGDEPRDYSMFQLTFHPDFTEWNCSGTVFGLMSFEEYMEGGWKLFESPEFPTNAYPPCVLGSISDGFSQISTIYPDNNAFDPWRFFTTNLSETRLPVFIFWMIVGEPSLVDPSHLTAIEFDTLLRSKRYAWSEKDQALLQILSASRR